MNFNLPLILFLLTATCGLFWLADMFYFLPQRKKTLAFALKDIEEKANSAKQSGVVFDNIDSAALRTKLLQRPWWIEWTAGLFGVFLTVFLLRSFIAEPFNIPSGSMMPTLEKGDFILVDKRRYGFRLPLIHTLVWRNQMPMRGDVIVFRLPSDESQDYIKRIIGLPGDRIEYFNKTLRINGEIIKQHEIAMDISEYAQYLQKFEQTLDGKTLHIYNYKHADAGVIPTIRSPNCEYSVVGIACTVPKNQYFVMGDNRDDSLDSRYWGFVPERNIVGRAFFIWMNFFKFERIGFIQ